MTDPLATPGQTAHLQSITTGYELSQKIVLLQTNDMEIIQFIVPAGKGIPNYEAQGELIQHCLEGRVTIDVLGELHNLNPGQLLYLSRNEPFSIQAIEDASMLTTIITAKQGRNVDVIGD